MCIRDRSLVAQNHDLLNHPNSFHGGLFKLNAKFDADSLLYLLSHFECDKIRTVHMLTQRCLLPPLTSTVKLLLFTHVHSSPLSLAARLHWCCANHFHNMNWLDFFRTDIIYMHPEEVISLCTWGTQSEPQCGSRIINKNEKDDKNTSRSSAGVHSLSNSS